MLVKVGAKEIDPPEQVEDILIADKFTTGFGFYQNTIELIEPALGNHIHVRNHFVALGVTHQIDIQGPGAEENPGFYFCRHWKRAHF
jgi:hypothetical protein